MSRRRRNGPVFIFLFREWNKPKRKKKKNKSAKKKKKKIEMAFEPESDRLVEQFPTNFNFKLDKGHRPKKDHAGL